MKGKESDAVEEAKAVMIGWCVGCVCGKRCVGAVEQGCLSFKGVLSGPV